MKVSDIIQIGQYKAIVKQQNKSITKRKFNSKTAG